MTVQKIVPKIIKLVGVTIGKLDLLIEISSESTTAHVDASERIFFFSCPSIHAVKFGQRHSRNVRIFVDLLNLIERMTLEQYNICHLAPGLRFDVIRILRT